MNINTEAIFSPQPELKTERQVPCSPLEWDEFKSFLSKMGIAVLQGKETSNRRITLAKYHTLICLGGYTGLRGSDLLSVTWEMVIGKEKFRITEGKTKKVREITLNEKCQNLIRHNYKLIKPYSDALSILYNKKFEPITINAFNDQLEIYFSLFGVSTDNPSSHTLRKTFGKRFYEVHGKSEHALVLLMGIFNHSTLEETRKYIGITRIVIANGYKLLD